MSKKASISQVWCKHMYNMLHMHNRTLLRCIAHILGHWRIKRLIKNCVGGEKASREFPKCHSKNVQKNGNSIESKIDRKPLSWRKLISLVSVFILPSISENLKNRLKMRTTGDITTPLWISYHLQVFQSLSPSSVTYFSKSFSQSTLNITTKTITNKTTARTMPIKADIQSLSTPKISLIIPTEKRPL